MSDLKSNNPFRSIQQEAELEAPPPVYNPSVRPPTYHPTEFGQEYQEHVNTELRNWHDPDGLPTLSHPSEFEYVEEPAFKKTPWWRTSKAKKIALAIGILLFPIAGALVFALGMVRHLHRAAPSTSDNATTNVTLLQTTALPTRSLTISSNGQTDTLVIIPTTTTSLAVVTASPGSGSASVATSTQLQVVESTSTLTPRSSTKSRSVVVVTVTPGGRTVQSTTVITTTLSPSSLPRPTVTVKTTIT
ncbi:hypothetical protein EJ03DRAFT_336824 [Teratosphaeria nubilosa]|uniref:Uncharacterized protein n=1 Tax=Teratosphaeria nubilosa TaxID=161662 RepID=A0A6G1L732_9PEZI|nr:hypothetical protein EJ03DRAFT_336824 [Teratosphaeria nubilosa]